MYFSGFAFDFPGERCYLLIIASVYATNFSYSTIIMLQVSKLRDPNLVKKTNIMKQHIYTLIYLIYVDIRVVYCNQ